MNRNLTPMLLALALAGCASLTEKACHADGAGWTALGEYDAVMGDQPWIEAYAEVCRPYGTAVDDEAYLRGWDVGHAEFNRRVDRVN